MLVEKLIKIFVAEYECVYGVFFFSRVCRFSFQFLHEFVSFFPSLSPEFVFRTFNTPMGLCLSPFVIFIFVRAI